MIIMLLCILVFTEASMAASIIYANLFAPARITRPPPPKPPTFDVNPLMPFNLPRPFNSGTAIIAPQPFNPYLNNNADGLGNMQLDRTRPPIYNPNNQNPMVDSRVNRNNANYGLPPSQPVYNQPQPPLINRTVMTGNSIPVPLVYPQQQVVNSQQPIGFTPLINGPPVLNQQQLLNNQLLNQARNQQLNQQLNNPSQQQQQQQPPTETVVETTRTDPVIRVPARLPDQEDVLSPDMT